MKKITGKMKSFLSLIIVVTFLLSGCGSAAVDPSDNSMIQPISKEAFVQLLENTCQLKNGEDFKEVNDFKMEVSRVEDEKLFVDMTDVDAVVAEFDDGLIAYCTFESKEAAESDLYAALSSHMETPYKVGICDGSDHKYAYAAGEPGYLVKKLSNVWDAYYYFDNVVIYIVSFGKNSEKHAQKLLKEIGYPGLSF